MSVFDEIDMASQEVTEDVFGDAITVLPQLASGPNYGGGADPARPQRPLIGAVSNAPTARPLQIAGKTAPGSPVAYAHTEIWVSASAYAGLGYELAQRDLVEFGAGVRKTIIDVRTGDQGDVVLIIGR